MYTGLNVRSQRRNDEDARRAVLYFVEMDSRLMTPIVSFPGFRISIESHRERHSTLRRHYPNPRPEVGGPRHVGVVICRTSSFRLAPSIWLPVKNSASCWWNARRELPIIAFISSGGMQTKEGAGALFPMALPAIASDLSATNRPCSGFGDCTGGGQANFVTHPLVRTYYFSGCSAMPFAGQIVVTDLPLSPRYQLSEPRAGAMLGNGEAPVPRKPG
jgi:hypothetical protein